MQSAGRQTPAHPHSLTGCAFDLRRWESLSHSRAIFSLFFTFLSTDLSPLFSLFVSQCCRGGVRLLGGGHATGSRLFCWCIPASQGTDAGAGAAQTRRSTETPCPGHHGSLGCGTGAGWLLFLSAQRRGGEDRWRSSICCTTYLGARRPRQKKLLGLGTSAAPGLAKVCSETSVGFGRGPGKGISNVRPKHGAEERKQRQEERARCAGLRENKGGTSNAGCSDPFPPFAVTAVQQGTEERLAEGKAFSSHFGHQSLPLRD